VGSVGLIIGASWFVYRGFWHLELEQMGNGMTLHTLVVYIVVLIAISLYVGAAAFIGHPTICAIMLLVHSAFYCYVEGNAFAGTRVFDADSIRRYPGQHICVYVGDVYPGALVIITSFAGVFAVSKLKRYAHGERYESTRSKPAHTCARALES